MNNFFTNNNVVQGCIDAEVTADEAAGNTELTLFKLRTNVAGAPLIPFGIRKPTNEAITDLKPVKFFFSIDQDKPETKKFKFIDSLNDFLASFIIKFDNAFSDKFSTTTINGPTFSEDQESLFTAYENVPIDLAHAPSLKKGGNAKTPQDAIALLNAKFQQNQRAAVIDYLIYCYTLGYYSPVGMAKRDQNQKTMITKLLKNEDQKTINNIIKICKKLLIGAKDGYKLDHFIKAYRKGSIIPEFPCKENSGTLDFLFFPNAIGMVPYLITYCSVISRVLRIAIQKNNNKWKKESDLEFDIIASDPQPWSDFYDGDIDFTQCTDETMSILLHVFCVMSKIRSYAVGRRTLVRYLYTNIEDPNQFELMNSLVKSSSVLGSNLMTDLENLELPSFVEELALNGFVCEGMTRKRTVLRFARKEGGSTTYRIVGGTLKNPDFDRFKLTGVQLPGLIMDEPTPEDIAKYFNPV